LGLKESLIRGLGIKIVVQKERTLYLIGQTRVHLDRVEGLGDYMELEVVLTENDTQEAGTKIAADLMEKLGINETDLVSGAYADHLMKKDGKKEAI